MHGGMETFVNILVVERNLFIWLRVCVCEHNRCCQFCDILVITQMKWSQIQIVLCWRSLQSHRKLFPPTYLCVIGPIDNVKEDEHEWEHFARYLVYFYGEDAVLQVAVCSEIRISAEATAAAAAVASYAPRQSPIAAPKAVSSGAATEPHLKFSAPSVRFC